MTAQAATPSVRFPLARPHRGSWRSGLLTGLFSSLAVTGLWLWLQPDSGAVVLAHVAAGWLMAALLAGWLPRHVRKGLGESRRAAFTLASWALLTVWAILIGTGIVMALPGALWFLGVIWFPDRAVSGALSFLHLWVAFVAVAGLILHLAQRHWARP